MNSHPTLACMHVHLVTRKGLSYVVTPIHLFYTSVLHAVSRDLFVAIHNSSNIMLNTVFQNVHSYDIYVYISESFYAQDVV